MEALGSQVGSHAFPVLHVACRLEEIAEGLWPEAGIPCTGGSQLVVAALVQVQLHINTAVPLCFLAEIHPHMCMTDTLQPENLPI